MVHLMRESQSGKSELERGNREYATEVALRMVCTLPSIIDKSDLIVLAQKGLAEAARTYDFSSSVPFRFFAYRKIRETVYQGLAIMARQAKSESDRLRFLDQTRPCRIR